MFQRAVAASRYAIALVVACIALTASAVFVYGAILTAQTIARPFRDDAGKVAVKPLILAAIELADLFLIGVTLYVIALGLYELFVDPTLPTPPWLVIKDIDDLKARVLGMVVVILGILFLGQALTWDGQRDLLRYGAAIALVIAALTYFLGQKSSAGGE